MLHLRTFFVLALLLLTCVLPRMAGQAPTGPAAEKRFPPLKLPPGFKATLFACDPFVEYPSAVARGPRRGTILVAVDYMTGLGTEIVRRDEVRLLEDTDGDGYADKSTVFAKGFNSIMGLEYHGDTLYVMHSPFLTAVRDTNGDDQADERRDLLSGLGLTPEKNPVRLHCANGVIMGHDGWLYLAMGDNGSWVPRPGQKDLVLEGGGILRCRPDGSHVHVFATGLRNIYDVALNDDLDVFVRDNENDGGDYKIRVCHSFFGADHGYPYLYYERPDEALPPIGDFGLGSSAGGVVYQETLFPPEFRGNLFFCEWGRSVARYALKPAGSGFAPVKEIDFVVGAPSDPYPFKPTDLVVDHDGALIAVDWADGQRPKRGRARIYRITPTQQASAAPEPAGNNVDGLIRQLDSESYYQRIAAQRALIPLMEEGAKPTRAAWRRAEMGVRARLHAPWILARLKRPVRSLLEPARQESEPRVQVQWVRAIADGADPNLGGARADAAALAEELVDYARGKDPRVVREVIVALGRLEWAELPARLETLLTSSDAALDHAAQQALRRSKNWAAILKLLDLPDDRPARRLALRALADQVEPAVVDGLIERLGHEKSAARRQAYADLLTRVGEKPGPWVYWGYRPPPRPANGVAWERTEVALAALERVLADPDHQVRLAILRRMEREKIPPRLESLTRWFAEERGGEAVATLLQSLGNQPVDKVRPALARVVGDKAHSVANRQTALALLADRLDKKAPAPLLDLANALEDGPVLATLLQRFGSFDNPALGKVFLAKVTSSSPAVRAAALEGLAQRQVLEAGPMVPALLEDKDAHVRRAAAVAAGKLRVGAAANLLLERVRDVDTGVRVAALEALDELGERRVVPLALAALKEQHTELAALRCLVHLGSAEHADVVTALAKRNVSAEILTAAVAGITRWARDGDRPTAEQEHLNRAVADIQGASGALLRWHLVGPLSDVQATAVGAATPTTSFALPASEGRWRTEFAAGAEMRWRLKDARPGTWVGFSDVILPEATPVQFLGSAGGPYRVWLNGKPAFQRAEGKPSPPDADRFSATLAKGLTRVLVQLDVKSGAELQLRFRKVSSKAEHERLIEAALAKPGNKERGQKVWSAVEKSSCLKCHRLGDQGEKVGPDLTGVGQRFSRIYLIESILQPNRTIAPSFESVFLEMKDGKVLTGLPVAETESALTLVDNQGQKHELKKAAIAERRRHPQSTMPEGLEQRLTADEFVDLITFLASQQAPR